MRKLFIFLVIVLIVLLGVKSIHFNVNIDEESTVTITMKPVDEFISDAKRVMDDVLDDQTTTQTVMTEYADYTGLFRIRRSWEDELSQLGAFKNYQSAISECPSGYSVYDDSGITIYSAE